MPTKITLNSPKQRPLVARDFTSTDGVIAELLPDGAKLATVFIDSGKGRLEIYGDSGQEPIPMVDMRPGDVGVITSRNDGCDAYIGEFVVYPHGGTGVNLLLGHNLIASAFVVRLLQPRESLLIEVVDEPPLPETLRADADDGAPEPANIWCHDCADYHVDLSVAPCKVCYPDASKPNFRPIGGETPEPDDQFERLGNGARMECGNCGYRKAGSPVCNRVGGKCHIADSRGICGHAHPCWRPIEPTLADALRTGTSEEIVAAAVKCDWFAIRDAVNAMFSDAMTPICCIIRSRNMSFLDDVKSLATVVVALRDRLDLFGEESDGE